MTDEERILGQIAAVRGRQNDITVQLGVEQHAIAIAKKESRWLAWKLRYYNTANRLRMLAHRLIGWRLGMVVIYLAIIAILVFFAEIILGYGWFMAMMGLTLAGTLIVLHYVPGEDILTESQQAATNKLQALVAKNIQHEANVNALKDESEQLARQEDELHRQALRANRQWQLHQHRLSLLAMPWKSYRSEQFEQFLKQVFEALDCSVETTKVTGDQGADLLFSDGRIRIAVQVKGYVSSVGNAAVQQAYSGMKFYNCDGCTVITNSIFTPAAVKLAQATG